MKKVVIILLVIAFGALVINDLGRFTRTRYDLDMATNEITDEVAAFAGSMSRDQAAGRAATMAASRGVRVYQYDQNGTGVQVWTEADVQGTWVLGRYAAWRNGKPPETPYVLRDQASSVYR